MQYKIENDQLIPAPANFRTPAGQWIINFNQSPELMTQYDFTMTEADAEEWRRQHPAPPPTPRTTCTKYQLVTCLQTYFPELLASLRQAYAASSDLQFYWNSVLDLDRNNADFQNLAQTLGVTSEQLDTIFAKIGE